MLMLAQADTPLPQTAWAGHLRVAHLDLDNEFDHKF
jgi:hypothetical protein